MKIRFLMIFCLIFSVFAWAQKNQAISPKDKKIIEHFEKNYKKQNYKKFNGTIIVNNNNVSFDKRTITFDTAEKIIQTILKNGLIYPQLISEYQAEKYKKETTDRTQKRFMKIQKDWKSSFDIVSLKLSQLQDLQYFKNNIQVKRFKVISKNNNLPNSVIYFFELTNEKATAKTNLEDFVNGAKLTFFEQEWYE
ncbi:hypothetical protein SAMN05421796_10614 [Chryseobacterium piscicola]|uniref:Uncharacterized protein n=2 Tax=Chryseobacterium TaxID=59732 RepID=A0A1N7MXU2_9FLAO|nr:hypothetical protein [Chryseobacterium piscicola]PQA93907.1 hypothetical protein B0A70_08975 [Chryseobacterium piscicola]SIS90902.1 hypothetical protein SAMN05421796_10614 [Chryseobacterium piscicola]